MEIYSIKQEDCEQRSTLESWNMARDAFIMSIIQCFTVSSYKVGQTKLMAFSNSYVYNCCSVMNFWCCHQLKKTQTLYLFSYVKQIYTLLRHIFSLNEKPMS